MNKLFSVFVAIFGFATVTSAQVNTVNMPVPGAGPVIISVTEDWDGAVNVNFTSDYYPVTVVVNGDTSIVEEVSKTELTSFNVEPVRGPFYQRTYNVSVSSIRGTSSVPAQFFDMKNVKDENTYFYNKKKYTFSEIPLESLEDTERELVIQDYRKPTLVQGDPTFEELGNDADFDTISFEYEYTKEYDMMPQFVESIDAQGKVFRRNIKFLQTGLRHGEERGVMIVGTILRATPFSEKPGETTYYLNLVMRDGKQLRKKLVVLTDVPEPL